ncbi:MAG TPA: hypothetical protein VM677_08450 [Actinokineospora sp.]|jgi:hypothetical protein|nr:hypothetical protein [Actinokineospora sp.]
MSRTDLRNSVSVAQSIVPAVRTANTTVNGTGVDLAGYDAAVVVVTTGTITDGTHTIEVQHSDDNSAYAAVADADLGGAEPAIAAANDDTTYEIGYHGIKRYVRVAVTTAGATSGGAFGASVVRGKPRKLPK